MGLFRSKRCTSSGTIVHMSLVADYTQPSKIRCPTCNQSIVLFKDTQGRYLVIERHNSITHRKGQWDRIDETL